MKKKNIILFLTMFLLTESTIIGCGTSPDAAETFQETEAAQPLTAVPETLPEPESEAELELESENQDIEDAATDWVADLQAASYTDQLIVVAASGCSATVSMHTKNADGTWTEILSVDGRVGQNGIGQASEWEPTTPQGIWGFSHAFGNQRDPGTALPYTQVDGSYYWVDDVNSAYYNQFVSTNSVACDWSSAENIVSCGTAYDYVLALDYNSDCVPGAGSAMFLHVKPEGSFENGTAGCIAVPRNAMIQVMQNVQPGCRIIVDTVSGVYNY